MRGGRRRLPGRSDRSPASSRRSCRATARSRCGSCSTSRRSRKRVVVTATRTEAPAGQVGASVTDVHGRGSRTAPQTPLVADLLRAHAGRDGRRAPAAPGAVTSLFVRGGESNYNKVLLDGIPLNEPGRHVQLQQPDDRQPRAHRDRARRAVGAVRIRCDGERRAAVHQARRAGRDEPAARDVLVRRRHATTRCARGAAVSGARARSTTPSARRASTPTTACRTTSSRTRRCRRTSASRSSDTATLRFIGRGELERVGTPGQTAFGRPDLDAFFERHDGVGGVTFDQQVERRRSAARVVLAGRVESAVDEPRSPIRRTRRASRTASRRFEFSDFLYDSRTNLRRHHASYQADWRLATDASAHGDQLLTLLADWDGERATLEDRLAGTPTPRVARQLRRRRFSTRRCGRACSSRLARRVEHNESFGTAVVPRGSIVYVVHAAAGRRSARPRCKASAGLGIKEPTMLQSFSLSPFFRGNPDLEPERSRTRRGRHRAAPRRRPRADRRSPGSTTDYQQPHLDAHDELRPRSRRSTSTSG